MASGTSSGDTAAVGNMTPRVLALFRAPLLLDSSSLLPRVPGIAAAAVASGGGDQGLSTVEPLPRRSARRTEKDRQKIVK